MWFLYVVFDIPVLYSQSVTTIFSYVGVNGTGALHGFSIPVLGTRNMEHKNTSLQFNSTLMFCIKIPMNLFVLNNNKKKFKISAFQNMAVIIDRIV